MTPLLAGVPEAFAPEAHRLFYASGAGRRAASVPAPLARARGSVA
ncbi:hypothetical protein [Rubricoccus marinus]|nr:hypothetical protein [Rubricoccus marinus]